LSVLPSIHPRFWARKSFCVHNNRDSVVMQNIKGASKNAQEKLLTGHPLTKQQRTEVLSCRLLAEQKTRKSRW
jgi:hypothetical protein